VQLPSLDENGLAALLDTVVRMRGVDLQGYKRSCLRRRISLRMREAKAASVEAYSERLLRDPAEVERLLHRIFVTYSEFFRDPSLFRFFERNLLPAALSGAGCRIWSAGCARGEEAYSLAMLVAETRARLASASPVRIFATDIHEPAIEHARAGVYSDAEVESVPPAMRAAFFNPARGGLQVRHALRRTIVFARHDLARDAPIGKIDILFCRNTHIYFDRALQRQVLASLLYALRPGGLLVLGRSEMPQRWVRPVLEPVDVGLRIFRKRGSEVLL